MVNGNIEGDPSQTFRVAPATEDSHSVNLGQFLGLKAANGYQKLPGGLILQWGTTVPMGPTLTGVSVIFPIAFPSTVVYVNCIGTTTRAGSAEANSTIYSRTTTSFMLASGNGATQAFMWFAIGY